MAPTTENAIISKRDSVVWCDLSGEVVLLDISSGVYFGMKGVGWTLWQYLESPRSLQSILDHLTSEYAVERSVCQQQTLAFIDKLAQHGLIDIREQ